MQPMNSMQDLMLVTLQNLYTAEQQALQAYPQLMQAVQSPELRTAIQQHEQETRGHVQRLEQVFQQLGQQPQQAANPVMDAMVQHGRQLMQAGGDPSVLEAALICEAQKMEHLEIAGYGTAVTFAKLLGNQKAADLLAQTLDEEKRTDERLTQIAQSRVNQQAAQTA